MDSIEEFADVSQLLVARRQNLAIGKAVASASELPERDGSCFD